VRPVAFRGYNSIFGSGQPEYIPLPVYIDRERNEVTSCWTFTFRERLRILFGARLFWSQLTFRGPLQPVKPSLDWKP